MIIWMDAHYILLTSLWKFYKKYIPYFSGKFLKLCSNERKVTMVSKHTLIQISFTQHFSKRNFRKIIPKRNDLIMLSVKKISGSLEKTLPSPFLLDWLIDWCLMSSEQFFSNIQDDLSLRSYMVGPIYN